MGCSLPPGGSTNISQSPAPGLKAAAGDAAIFAPLLKLFKRHFCVTVSNAEQVSTPGHQRCGVSRNLRSHGLSVPAATARRANAARTLRASAFDAANT